MIIVHDRKRKQFDELYPNIDSFVLYLRENYSKINFENQVIKKKICDAYDYLTSDLDEIIQHTRMTRRLKSVFGFSHQTVTKKVFWIERGWSKLETDDIINKIIAERAIKQSKTKKELLKNKHELIIDGSEKEFRFISGKFNSIVHPTCNYCNSELDIKKVNINNLVDKFYNKIYQLLK